MIENHIEEIQSMLNQGMSASDIAKTLGIQQTSLNAYFYHHRDIFPKRGRYRYIDDDESMMMHKEYYIDKIPKRQIAIKHNVCEATVKRHIDAIDFLKKIEHMGR